jgi:hypothetical protein
MFHEKGLQGDYSLDRPDHEGRIPVKDKTASAALVAFYKVLSVWKKREKRSFKMGKSMYNFGKQSKEKARQKKQMDKAAKRVMAKQQKAGLTTEMPKADSDTAEPKQEE